MNSELIEELAKYTGDPRGFVMFAYPWGEPGTELEGRTGPNAFQDMILQAVKEGLPYDRAIKLAVASGHGIGKSALLCWLIDWSMSTFPDTRGVLTASTETQLRTRTWVELSKWHRLSITRDMFELGATSLRSRDPAHSKEWRFDAVPWSENNPQAFAGLHNLGKRIVLLFDEGSTIADKVWEVADGALTDANTQILWVCCGNPEKASGRFRECFPGGKFANRWRTWNIDSRTVPHTNRELFDAWVADWGEDSDFVKVRVRGMFPREDVDSFISAALAQEAAERTVVGLGPMVIGVDPARYGRDPAVIYFRRGLDGKSVPPRVFPTIDTMELAHRVELAYLEHKAVHVFVDAGGVGAGVVDRLIQRRVPVVPVEFAARADNAAVEAGPGVKYKNKRAEIWGSLKAWLRRGAIVDQVPSIGASLVSELASVHAAVSLDDSVQLESKQHMKQRGVASPNIADALACTFAYPDFEQPSDIVGAYLKENADVLDRYPDYDPFDRAGWH